MALSTAALLAGCGGSDEESAAAPAGATAEDLADARASQVAGSFDATSHELVVTWRDEFIGEQGFRIETQNSAGSWVQADTVSAGRDSGTSITWRRVLDQTTTFRVLALRDGYTVPLERSTGGSELTVNLQAADALSIEIDQVEPVSGTVQLSVTGADNAGSVSYLAGPSSIGQSAVAPRFATDWNTGPVEPGTHLLAARVEQTGGVVIERRRVVTVADATAALSLSWQQSAPGAYRLIATASAPSGISRVEFFADNQALGSVTTSTTSDTWVFEPFDTASRPPGVVLIKAVATGNAGERAEITKRFTADRLPQVTLTEPLEGSIFRVGDSIKIAGTLTDDLPGAFVRVFIGNTLVREVPGNQFDIDQPTTGLAAGRYDVRVRVVDSSGQEGTDVRGVNVTASTLQFQLVGSLPTDTALLNSDGGSLLYQLPDGAVRRWDAPNSEVELSGSKDIIDLSTPYPLELWIMSRRYVTTVGTISGSPTTYLFNPAGERQEIPYTPGSFFNLSLRSLIEGPWLASGTDLIHIQNLTTSATHDVPGNLYNGGAFSATPGSERLFFTRNNGTINAQAVVDLYAYQLSNQSVTLLTGGGAVNSRPKTDGTRVAWERVPLPEDPNIETRVLLAAPTTNPTSSAVKSPTMRGWDLADGWLAWLEETSGVLAVKVDDGSSTQTISSGSSTGLQSTSAGHVVFNENDALYTWNSSQGKRLMLESVPQQLVQDDGIAFIAVGGSSSTLLVYRVVQ